MGNLVEQIYYLPNPTDKVTSEEASQMAVVNVAIGPRHHCLCKPRIEFWGLKTNFFSTA